MLAVEALDGYLVKLRGSKEDVPFPYPEHGGFTGNGHGQKPSEWLTGSYVRGLKEGIATERVLLWMIDGGPQKLAIPLYWR